MRNKVEGERHRRNIDSALLSINYYYFLGPWAWNQFLREHSFDFLGVSGNAEVKEASEYLAKTEFSLHIIFFLSILFLLSFCRHRCMEAPKFGQLINDICTNCIWNVSTIPIEELAMDMKIRKNPERLRNTARDILVSTTILKGTRIFILYS